MLTLSHLGSSVGAAADVGAITVACGDGELGRLAWVDSASGGLDGGSSGGEPAALFLEPDGKAVACLLESGLRPGSVVHPGSRAGGKWSASDGVVQENGAAIIADRGQGPLVLEGHTEEEEEEEEETDMNVALL